MEKSNKKNTVITESLQTLQIVKIFSPVFFELFLMVMSPFMNKIYLKKLNKKRDKYLEKKLSSIVGEDIIVWRVENEEVNAFTMAKENNLEVYYFSGLELNKFNKGEIIAILLHEYGHCKENHGSISMKRYCASSTITSVIWSILINMKICHGDLKMGGTILSLFYYLMTLAGLGSDLTSRSLRFTEREADQYPVKYGYKKEFLSALTKIKKIMYEELCDETMTERQCDRYVKETFYFDEHPPIKERIRDVGKSLSMFFNVSLSLIKSGNINKLKNMIKKIIKLKKMQKKMQRNYKGYFKF